MDLKRFEIPLVVGANLVFALPVREILPATTASPMVHMRSSHIT